MELYTRLSPWLGILPSYGCLATSWRVIQRRKDGSVDFFRNWEDYKHGFGSVDGEFWIGMESIRRMIRDGMHTLRFDFWDKTRSVYAMYRNVTIADESDNYRIDWLSFEGNSGDSMQRSKGMQFSTKDRDNHLCADHHCAVLHPGAFWMNCCMNAHPNGGYGDTRDSKGTFWFHSGGYKYPFANVEMKIKRA